MKIDRIPAAGVQLLRDAKHRAAGAVRRFQWRRYMSAVEAERLANSRKAWKFLPDRYPGSAVAAIKPSPCGSTAPLPRRLFVIWAGLNNMPATRLACLEAIRETQSGLEVVLVTPESLSDWLVPEHPLPRCYPALSAVDKSDYLRAYLMHHHGGGYSDIKIPRHRWLPVFDELDAASELYGAGYPSKGDIGVTMQPLDFDMRVNEERVCGMAALILKPHTQFTAAVLTAMERFLYPLEDEIIRHPGGIMGQVDNSKYPIEWSQLARVVNQVSYALSDFVLVTDKLSLNLDQATYR